MRKLRKEYCTFSYQNKSKFDCKDFRSKEFSGNWTKHLLKDLQNSAMEQKKTIFNLLPHSILMKEEHFPKKLFKFFSVNSNSMNCLEKQTVFVASPTMFNDPFDCNLYASREEFIKSYMIKKIKEEKLIDKGELTEQDYNNLLSSRCDIDYSSRCDTFSNARNKLDITYRNRLFDIWIEASDQFDKKMKNMQTAGIRVCCFAALSFEQLETFTEMWSHYANQHKGFCVEYDFSNIDFKNYQIETPPSIDNIALGGLLECTYQSKPITLLKSLIYKSFWGLKMGHLENTRLEKQIIQSFTTKSSAWSYEHEWRMIINSGYSEIYNHLIPFPHVSAV